MLIRIEASSRHMSEHECIKLVSDVLYPCHYSGGRIYVRTEDLPRGIRSIPQWVWARGLCKHVADSELCPSLNSVCYTACTEDRNKIPERLMMYWTGQYKDNLLFDFRNKEVAYSALTICNVFTPITRDMYNYYMDVIRGMRS